MTRSSWSFTSRVWMLRSKSTHEQKRTLVNWWKRSLTSVCRRNAHFLIITCSSSKPLRPTHQQNTPVAAECCSMLQQVSRINIGDIPMLSTTIKVAESARDLGVILDAELTMSAHVTARCRSGFFQLRQLRPFTLSLTTEAAKTLVQGLYLAVWTTATRFCMEWPIMSWGKFSRYRMLQHASSPEPDVVTTLRQCYVNYTGFRVEFKLACLVHQALCDQMYAQQLWRQKLWRCRPMNLEQSAARPTDTGHQLQTF